MSLTKPQKTIIICSGFIAGIGAGMLGHFPLIASILVSLVLFFAYKKVFSAKFSVFLVFVLAFSFFYCKYKTPLPTELFKAAPAKLYLRGRVITEPRPDLENRTRFEFQAGSYMAEGSEWKSTNSKTIINIYDNERKFENIHIGDVLEAEGYVKIPYEATNPGQFDYGEYLKTKGIFTLTYVRYNAWKIIEHPQTGKWLLIQELNKIKNRVIEENKKYLKSPKLEIIEGMVFGDYAVPAPEDIKQTFIKSGLLHLLAASGMNVGFIFGFWFFFATRLRLPYKSKMIIGAVLVLFYSLLTGLPPSIVRAAAMLEFLIIGKIFNRQADTVTLLALVCAMMLLGDPFLLANVSFQLSYITTLGILLCTQPVLEKTRPVPEVISGAVVIPVIAQLWASPIQIFHFNNFSTYSVLANILVIPFVGVITFLGFTGNILSFIPLIGTKILWLFDKLAEPFIDIVLFTANYISRLPNSLYFITKPSVLLVIAFYGLIFAALYTVKKDFSSKKLNATVIILSVTLLFFIFPYNFNKKLELVFFDVGQGDAALLHTPDNKNILIDTGPSRNFSPAKSAIIPYLHNKGINKLDALLLTHPDYDHTGGTIDILENIPVKTVLHNGLEDNSKTSRAIKKYILDNNVGQRILKDGEELDTDKNIYIKAIIPPDTDKRSDNENSIMLYIAYKDFSALLMADCEAESFYLIKKYIKNPINLLKVGHHGSNNSVNSEFLGYLKPKLSVISVGERGYKYGHPNKQVLEDLSKFNVNILRTDKDYAITVTSNGKNNDYRTFKAEKNRR